MPSSSCTNTSGAWSMQRPSPVQRSWSIHTRTRAGYRSAIGPSGRSGARAGTAGSGERARAAGSGERSKPPAPTGDRRQYAAGVLEPPVAKRVAHTWDRPTGPVDDPWAWLADTDDPDTLAYLEAENAYADAWLGEHAPLVDAIFDEIKARTQENDETVPARKGPWWYASRTVEGLAYPIHCRGATAATATEVVLLDENEEAGTGFFELGAFDVSPGHGLLAWSADRNGHEVFEMRIRDLAAGTDLPDQLEGTYYGTAWSADERYLFYTRPDHAMRPYQVWRHEVGTAQGDDVLVYEEPDEHY